MKALPLAEFLSGLRKMGIQLWVEGDRLRFNAPANALTPELRDELARRKAEIITFLHLASSAMHATTSDVTYTTIIPADRSKPIPLSFAQQRIWFLTQIDPNSATYNETIALQIKGSLQLHALEQSLNNIIQRHESLRTSFQVIDGQPHQVIHPPETFHLPIQTISTEQLDSLLSSEVHRPFKLDQGPLFRVTLLQLFQRPAGSVAYPASQQEYVLLLVIHHILWDDWSADIFLRELAQLYQIYSKISAHTTDTDSILPKLEIQYADFAVWQRQWWRSIDSQSASSATTQLNYWKQQLVGDLPALALPTDHPRPPIQTYRGANYRFYLHLDTLQALKVLSQQHNATLFMLLLAAFQVLLYRYSTQTDIIVGTPVANRTRKEIEGLIGFFVNTLAIRTDISGNPTFLELLNRVRYLAQAAYANQDLPFEEMVNALQLPRDPSRQAIFQVMLALQNAMPEQLDLGDLDVRLLEIEGKTAKFDLTLYLTENSQGITGRMEYNTDLFDRSTITQMVDHFQVLVDSIIHNPTQRIAELPLLTRADLNRLADWNRTSVDYPGGRYIYEYFEEQARQNPQFVALIFEGQSMSYHEMNCRANQLAHYLRKLGIGPESLVGVSMERSFEMVIALYGILKAGGAYVPLDPTYPSQRLAYMLADARVAVLLTQSILVDKLPVHNARIICLDREWGIIAQESSQNPACAIHDDNLAYMIYTSGSTGKPKGAMNTHAAILNRLLWMQDAYHLNSEDRVLQKTPFSFDVSVWEFFWPLMFGACLVIARPEGHKDSRYLVQLIKDQHISTIHFVPSMLQVFIEEPDIDKCSSLRRVICSGEALPLDLQERFFSRIPKHVELHNLYGPTEAAVDVTYWICQRQSDLHCVPIGFPIANIQIHLLDPFLHPTPVGVPGELCIGGIGLARGYHGRPELTAEKFIPDPFCLHPGARLYRTGDLACYQPDGSIKYLGRMDYQVKIRGFRIELGEIEFALSQYPTINEVIVVAQPVETDTSVQHASSNKQLVAYFTLASTDATAPTDLTFSDLRDFLKERLPDYMIPAVFIQMDTLPLNPNGKVDRKALPTPSLTRLKPKSYTPPQNTIETTLCSIWAEVLKVHPVGIHDNFFELGGDSILGMQIIAKARLANILLTPIQLFQYQSIAELANVISQVTLEQKPNDICTQQIPADFDAPLEIANRPDHYTPTDFPDAGLNQQELDDLLNELNDLPE